MLDSGLNKEQRNFFTFL